MWERSKSSTDHSWVAGLLALVLAVLPLPIGRAADAMLQADDLTNPDKLLEYRKRASQADRTLSEQLYQHGIAATKKDWASAAKSFGESALAYPNSRALVRMSESRLKMLAGKDMGIKVNALSDVAKYLNSALVLNTSDQMLSAEEKKQVEQDKACVERYLSTRKKSSNCRALAWIKLY